MKITILGKLVAVAALLLGIWSEFKWATPGQLLIVSIVAQAAMGSIGLWMSTNTFDARFKTAAFWMFLFCATLGGVATYRQNELNNEKALISSDTNTKAQARIAQLLEDLKAAQNKTKELVEKVSKNSVSVAKREVVIDFGSIPDGGCAYRTVQLIGAKAGDPITAIMQDLPKGASLTPTFYKDDEVGLNMCQLSGGPLTVRKARITISIVKKAI